MQNRTPQQDQLYQALMDVEDTVLTEVIPDMTQAIHDREHYNKLISQLSQARESNMPKINMQNIMLSVGAEGATRVMMKVIQDKAATAQFRTALMSVPLQDLQEGFLEMKQVTNTSEMIDAPISEFDEQASSISEHDLTSYKSAIAPAIAASGIGELTTMNTYEVSVVISQVITELKAAQDDVPPPVAPPAGVPVPSGVPIVSGTAAPPDSTTGDPPITASDDDKTPEDNVSLSTLIQEKITADSSYKEELVKALKIVSDRFKPEKNHKIKAIEDFAAYMLKSPPTPLRKGLASVGNHSTTETVISQEHVNLTAALQPYIGIIKEAQLLLRTPSRGPRTQKLLGPGSDHTDKDALTYKFDSNRWKGATVATPDNLRKLEELVPKYTDQKETIDEYFKRCKKMFEQAYQANTSSSLEKDCPRLLAFKQNIEAIIHYEEMIKPLLDDYVSMRSPDMTGNAPAGQRARIRQELPLDLMLNQITLATQESTPESTTNQPEVGYLLQNYDITKLSHMLDTVKVSLERNTRVTFDDIDHQDDEEDNEEGNRKYATRCKNMFTAAINKRTTGDISFNVPPELQRYGIPELLKILATVDQSLNDTNKTFECSDIKRQDDEEDNEEGNRNYAKRCKNILTQAIAANIMASPTPKKTHMVQNLINLLFVFFLIMRRSPIKTDQKSEQKAQQLFQKAQSYLTKHPNDTEEKKIVGLMQDDEQISEAIAKKIIQYVKKQKNKRNVPTIDAMSKFNKQVAKLMLADQNQKKQQQEKEEIVRKTQRLQRWVDNPSMDHATWYDAVATLAPHTLDLKGNTQTRRVVKKDSRNTTANQFFQSTAMSEFLSEQPDFSTLQHLTNVQSKLAKHEKERKTYDQEQEKRWTGIARKAFLQTEIQINKQPSVPTALQAHGAPLDTSQSEQDDIIKYGCHGEELTAKISLIRENNDRISEDIAKQFLQHLHTLKRARDIVDNPKSNPVAKKYWQDILDKHSTAKSHATECDSELNFKTIGRQMMLQKAPEPPKLTLSEDERKTCKDMIRRLSTDPFFNTSTRSTVIPTDDQLATHALTQLKPVRKEFKKKLEKMTQIDLQRISDVSLPFTTFIHLKRSEKPSKNNPEETIGIPEQLDESKRQAEEAFKEAESRMRQDHEWGNKTKAAKIESIMQDNYHISEDIAKEFLQCIEASKKPDFERIGPDLWQAHVDAHKNQQAEYAITTLLPLLLRYQLGQLSEIDPSNLPDTVEKVADIQMPQLKLIAESLGIEMNDLKKLIKACQDLVKSLDQDDTQDGTENSAAVIVELFKCIASILGHGIYTARMSAPILKKLKTKSHPSLFMTLSYMTELIKTLGPEGMVAITGNQSTAKRVVTAANTIDRMLLRERTFVGTAIPDAVRKRIDKFKKHKANDEAQYPRAKQAIEENNTNGKMFTSEDIKKHIQKAYPDYTVDQIGRVMQKMVYEGFITQQSGKQKDKYTVSNSFSSHARPAKLHNVEKKYDPTGQPSP